MAVRERSPGSGEADADRRASRRFALVGAGMLGVAFLIEPLIATLYPPHDYWRTSPSFVVLRLGMVLLLLSLCHRYERRAGIGERSVVALVGRESLLVYAAHLMLIYGDFPGFSFHRWAGRSFGYAEVLTATAVLLALMVLLAFWWDRIRRSGRRRMRVLQGLAAAGFLIAFLLGPR
jgi:peptidoglycan/LPS O-acetylase OafA/YrhL